MPQGRNRKVSACQPRGIGGLMRFSPRLSGRCGAGLPLCGRVWGWRLLLATPISRALARRPAARCP